VNEQLLDLINGGAGHVEAIDNIAIFIGSNGIYVLGAVLAVLGLLELRRHPRKGIEIGAAAALALALAGVAVFFSGLLINEARPFVTHPDTVQLMSHAKDNSFPSDHTTVAAAAAMVGALAWPKWGWALLVGALLIGLARVFSGIHYPGDIAGGMLIGCIAGFIAWLVIERVAVPRLPARTAQRQT
jgi:undecaprenyl-diphosphatase